MPGLLDLPREIREMIFKLVVVSPTRCIEAISREHARYREIPGCRSRSAPLCYLAVTPLMATSPNPKDYPEFISVSLLRVCRIIHQETRDLFWNSNTFVIFQAPILDYTFQNMSQATMQRITTLRLVLTPYGLVPKQLIKELQPVIEMSSGGSLKELVLVLKADDFKAIVRFQLHALQTEEDQSDWGIMYRGLLKTLNTISKLPIQKRFIVLGGTRLIESPPPGRDAIIEEVEREWGGEICWEDV